MRRRCHRERLLYACGRSVEAADSEIEFEVPLRLHRCCINANEESGVDLQGVNAFFEDYGWNESSET